MASHSEEQHDIFSSLIKAIEYEFSEQFDRWILPEKDQEDYVNLEIFYPIVIFQGALYSACLKKNRLYLTNSKHIQFVKQQVIPGTNKVITYQIDVIKEEYLVDYLEIVNLEINKIINLFRRHKKIVFDSMAKIVNEARNLEKKPDSYRSVLEFEYY